MHEMTFALSLLDVVEEHRPEGAVVKNVIVRVGPMHGIVKEAMEWAWEAATEEGNCKGASLELEFLPWRFECPQCGRRWEGEEMLEACVCGCEKVGHIDCDEFSLVGIDVED